MPFISRGSAWDLQASESQALSQGMEALQARFAQLTETPLKPPITPSAPPLPAWFLHPAAGQIMIMIRSLSWIYVLGFMFLLLLQVQQESWYCADADMDNITIFDLNNITEY